MFLTPEEINDIFDAGYKPHEDALDAVRSCPGYAVRIEDED